MLPSLVIKIEYCRALQRGSKEPIRPGSFSCLLSACTPWRADKSPISDFPATKIPSVSSSAAAFLPGSGKYVECDVTHSKQTTATFLPGATTASRRSAFRDGFICPRPFLTGSAPQTELTVTHSKQTLGKILTGARMHIKEFANPHFSAPKNLLLHRRPIEIFLRPTI